jgi:hypothetical protein
MLGEAWARDAETTRTMNDVKHQASKLPQAQNICFGESGCRSGNSTDPMKPFLV